MQDKNTDSVWEDLSYEDKNQALYLREKTMLELFLERKAITKEQYEKGMRELNNLLK